jgi:hypothetical protein
MPEQLTVGVAGPLAITLARHSPRARSICGTIGLA